MVCMLIMSGYVNSLARSDHRNMGEKKEDNQSGVRTRNSKVSELGLVMCQN